MPCCGSCCSSRAFDPEAPLSEVNLLEAGEYSLKLAIRLPRRPFFLPPQRRGEDIQLLVATLGGPDGDIVGPQKDFISCRCGGKVVHQVFGLLPDTRYTVEVSVVDDAMPLRSASSSIEVRTAAAGTCQFDPEDWGQTYFKKLSEDGDGKKGEKDRSAPSRTGSRSDLERGRSHAGPTMAPQQAAVPRSVSGADDSTIEPSDVDGADLAERNLEEWDFTTEEVCRERIVDEEPQVEEMIPPSPAIQCNLCSFMDCFKLIRESSRPETGEMLFHGNQRSSDSVSLPSANFTGADGPPGPRARRRPPFPGVAVDPASVGLELLPVLNESQLQHVFETRATRTRTADN